MRQRKKNIVTRQFAAETKVLTHDPPTATIHAPTSTGKETSLVSFKVPPSSKSTRSEKSGSESLKKKKIQLRHLSDEYVMENSRVAVDEVGLKNNLEFVMKAGVRSTGIARAILKRLSEVPPTFASELAALNEKMELLEKEKLDVEGKLHAMCSEVAKYQKLAREAKQARETSEKLLNENVSSLAADNEKLKKK
ncbi:hypothetical protein PIB30_037991 [Stylosanthes scabra]|uniref:Uncharacterized protein n=1 Tax=Stylosanthes scabra TaxID=79078 RepID=A0ABU6ZAS0_9FABA|nr:hypothetical protein [Stylosanthes scabra]